MGSNTFDEILSLEERFYEDGFQQGLTDGIKAGRIEGRMFGLEKGFEKYIESGRLHGKSIIWANRTYGRHLNVLKQEVDRIGEASSGVPSSTRLTLPALPNNARLSKHVNVLYALAESESLSTENTEEAVSDFDDRFKRAHAKAKIIEKMAGEAKEDSEDRNKKSGGRDGSIEDVNSINARH
jgi:hypothetical protein